MCGLIEELDKGVDQSLFDELEDARGVIRGINAKIKVQRLKQVKLEPSCPECGTGVLRPKCAFELGSDCPRHGLISELGGRTVLVEHLEKLKQESSV